MVKSNTRKLPAFSKCNAMLYFECFNYSPSWCAHIDREREIEVLCVGVYLLFHNMFRLLTLVLPSFRFSTCNLFKSTKAKVNVANVHFTGWLTNMKTGNSPVCMYVFSLLTSSISFSTPPPLHQHHNHRRHRRRCRCRCRCHYRDNVKTEHYTITHLHYGTPWRSYNVI